MSEKDKVLQQISEIKSHLVDKEVFFPYNYNAFHVWSLITIILTFVMIPSYEHSLFIGAIVTFILLSIGFIIEGTLTKKVNARYDIEDCTKRQQFIMKTFLKLSIFGILLSIVLATSKLYASIFILWLFLISIGQYAVAFVLNLKTLEDISHFNSLLAIFTLAGGLYFELLVKNMPFLYFTQAIVIFGLAILPSLFAYRFQKLESKGL